tara:strand:+ start:5964 stop:8093 length:2130 start_codon:yes stop_codon:yes gene_type:complete
MARRLQEQGMPGVKYSLTRLGAGVSYNGTQYPGGFDQTTPSLVLSPGSLRDCVNFECSQSGGYGRIAGYERVDGRASPSDATYMLVQVSSFTNVPAVGDTITQATSGATGYVFTVNNVAGAYYMLVTQVTGTFDVSHAISVGATPIGTATAITASLTSQENAIALAGAADVYRALIGAVPGSGPVRGVVAMTFSGVDAIYAFRDNAGGTAVDLYKSTTGGWTQVSFLYQVSFTTGGVATGLDGDVLTQGGVTATVKRVMAASGTWAGDTAAGILVITAPAGGNFAAGAATMAGSGSTVTLAAIQTAITMLPGGDFEFVKCNFSGQLVTRRIYGCDGVNKAFEFDGTTLAPIATGLSPDVPSHIAYHKRFLFLSQASSIFYSGPGTPFRWTATDGGGEIATGDTVTGMISLPGAQTSTTLAVYMDSNTGLLYGLSASDFNFTLFDAGTGAIPKTIQSLFDVFVFDHLGAITLKTSLNYGNFASSALTKNILPFVIQERTKLTTSSVSRDKSQYRVYFNDGYSLWLTVVNQQYVGASIILFPDPVGCVDVEHNSDGVELTYFGSTATDGYVYQMDTGNSFDGDAITAYITMAWDAIKSPRILKRFRAASIEVQGTAYASIQFGYRLGYGSLNYAESDAITAATNFAGTPRWDSFTWDDFVWDGQTLTPTDVKVTGTAENIQVTISSGTNYIAPYNINSLIYHYSDRRGMRV